MLTKIASYLFIYYPMAPLSHIATEHSRPIQASKLEIAPRCNGHHDKKKLKRLSGELQRSISEYKYN